jgi:phenylalanyl-tRNA synthetase alpha chain
MDCIRIVKTKKFAALSLQSQSNQEIEPTSKSKAVKQVTTPVTQSTTSAAADESTNKPDIESLVLSYVSANGEIVDTYDFAVLNQLDHQEVIGAVRSLMVDQYLVDEPLSVTLWSPTDEGKEVISKGSPEIQVLQAIPADGITVANLNKLLGETAKIGVGVCMKNKWIQKKGEMLMTTGKEVIDETQKVLQQVQETSGINMNEEELKNLKKRKLVQQITRKSYRVLKGPDFRENRVRKVADLTKQMLGKKEEVFYCIMNIL